MFGVELCAKSTWPWSLTPIKEVCVILVADGPQSSSLKQGNQGEVINTLIRLTKVGCATCLPSGGRNESYPVLRF